MKERRLITVACVAFRDAEILVMSHVYAALKSGDVSFDEMDELHCNSRRTTAARKRITSTR